MIDRNVLNASVVLVVDDSEAVRLLVQKILENLGIRSVLLAASAKEGLVLSASHLPDLVITDYQMEQMNGAQFVGALRRSPTSAINKVPIIMLTGHSEREVLQEAVDVGVNDFVVKPIEPKKLCERVLRALHKAQSA